MSTDYNNSHPRCPPDLLHDPVHPQLSTVARGVLSASECDEGNLRGSSFTVDSDSLPSKEGSSSIEACSSIAEDGSSSSSVAKKAAWNKPSSSNNGVGDVSEVVGVVMMGADSWPPLSESARATPKSPANYPLKSVSSGPIVPAQGFELVGSSSSSSSSPTKEIGVPSSTQKSASTHAEPTRHKSMKRAGGGVGGDGAGGSSSHTNTPANGSRKEVFSSPQTGGSVGESSKDAQNNGSQRVASYGRNEQQQPQRNGSFRNNNGPQFRGNGSHNHNNAARRDPHRGYNSRGNHGPQQRGPSPFLPGQPAPNPSPYYQIPYHVMSSYWPTTMVYPPEVSIWSTTPQDPWRPSMSFLPMPPVLGGPIPDPDLPSKILRQIDYYFSLENLIKDDFLRQRMDAEGWVTIDMIAGFPKVRKLTDNQQVIVDAIRHSLIVEVQGDKVRCRHDPKRWPLPSTPSPVTTPHSIASQNTFADKFNNLKMD